MPTLLLALALSAPAAADPVLLPAADPVDGVGVSAVVGGGTSFDRLSGASPRGSGAWFRVDGAPVDRLTIGARGVFGDNGADAWLSTSYAVIRRDAVALAPFVAYRPGSDLDVFLTGLAVEAGGERVRWDLSLPVLQVGYDDPPLMGLALAETGLTVAPIDGHEVRVGLTTVAAWSVRYRGGTDHVFVEAGVADILLENMGGGLTWLGVGARL